MKPILFSTPMVQAIMDGRKTMTRRVIKLPAYVKQSDMDDTYTLTEEDGGYSRGWSIPDMISNNYIKRPYYKRDVLWVRETFFCYECDPECAGNENEDECPFNWVDGKCYGYKAQYTPDGECVKDIKWRPSIFMPREAARLYLKVTSMRAERVQDISTSDCEREGIASDIDRFNGLMTPHHDWIVGEFARLWDSLNAKRGYGWDSNPWVWVVGFERIACPEK